MADPPTAAPAASPTGSGFMPQETITITIGRQNANVYPRVNPLTMSIAERAYAFHITTTALKVYYKIEKFGEKGKAGKR